MQSFRIFFGFFMTLSLVYSMLIIHDLFSLIAYLFAVLNLIALFPLNRKLLFINFILYTVDLVLKIVNPNALDYRALQSVNPGQVHWYNINFLDSSVVQNVVNMRIGLPEIIYSSIHVLLWLTICYYYGDRPWKWGPLVHQISYYSTPLLIYFSAYLSQQPELRIIYLLAYLGLVMLSEYEGNGLQLAKFITTIGLVVEYGIQAKNLKNENNDMGERWQQMYSIQTRISLLVRLFLVFSFQTHYTPTAYSLERFQSSISQNRRYPLRRKQSSIETTIFYKLVFLYTLTIALMIMTTGPGNIFVATAVYVNLPDHHGNLFRKLVFIGVAISFLLQPQIETLFYGLYLLILRDLQVHDVSLQKYSYRVIIQLSRLYILLSHVSFINFLLGLFRKPSMVLIAICFKIICRYFGQESILMGTNQSYGFHSIFSLGDTFLWIYLILLLMYSPTATPTFSSSNIPNIFEQYSFLKYSKVQYCLHVLKVFHWISYSFIALMVLNSKPSIFVLIRAVILFSIIVTDIVGSSQRKQKNRILNILWSLNLYISLTIAFIKYFYMMKLYLNEIISYQNDDDNDPLNVNMISPWLFSILSFLSKHAHLLGLQELTLTASDIDIWTMLSMFVNDICIVVISLIMTFIMEVRIYEDYREIVMHQQNRQHELQDRSEQNINNDEQKYNIHYLYRRYIKPIHFSFSPDRLRTVVISTFLIEILIVAIFTIYLFFEPRNTTTLVLYIPVVLCYAYYFYKTNYYPDSLQSNLNSESRLFTKLRLRVLMFIVCYSSFQIIFVYTKYVWRYVMFHNENAQIQYKLFEVVVKFTVLIVALIAYQFQAACPYQPQNHKNLELFTPPELKISPTYTRIFREITSHCIVLLEFLILSLWIHGFFNGHILCCVFRLFIIGFWISQQLKKQKRVTTLTDHYQNTKWSCFLVIAMMFDLWLMDSVGLLGIVVGRVHGYLIQTYYNFYQQQKLNEDQLNHTGQLTVIQEQKVIQQELQNQQNIHSSKDIELKQVSQMKKNQELQKEELVQEWKHLKSYRTLIYISPIVLSLLPILSTTYLGYSIIAFFLNIVSSLTLLLMLATLVLFQTKFRIKSKFLKLWIAFILIMGVLLYIGLLAYGYYLQYVTNDPINKYLQENVLSNGTGLSLLVFADCSLLYLLINRKTKMRASQASKYWKIKSKILAEIAAQLHNHKKLIALEALYIQRQDLQKRVNRLTQQLKTSKQILKYKKPQLSMENSMIESLSMANLLNQQRINDKYELYSNMLIVFDCETLTLCFQKLNLYDRNHQLPISIAVSNSRFSTTRSSQSETIQTFGDKELKQAQEVVKRARKIRQDVLRNYQRSLAQALKKWEVENNVEEDTQMKQESNSPQSRPAMAKEDEQMDEQFKLQDQLQRSPKHKLQQSYGQCFEIIHLTSMKYPLLIRKMIQNSEMLSMITIVGWNFYGGPYTIPVNIAIFSWAVVLEAKTTILFWLSLLLYASFIITLKIFLGSSLAITQYLNTTAVIKYLFQQSPTGCTYQFIVITLSTIQIILIHLSGTSFKSLYYRESIYGSFYRLHLNRHCVTEQIQRKLLGDDFTGKQTETVGEQKFMELHKSLTKPGTHGFFNKVFSKSRFKPGKDFYPLMSSIQLVILLYIFFFYDLMEYESKANRRSLGQLLTVDKFSANMVIAMFIQIMIMIIDRTIVSLNLVDEGNRKLQNFFLQFTFRGDSIQSKEKKTSRIIQEQETDNKKMKHEAPQALDSAVGLFDFLLLLKYLFHVFLLFFINFLVYFYIPSAGLKKSLIPAHCSPEQLLKQHRQACDDSSYTYLSIFLFLYLLYFLASGLQIKHGFNRNKCKNTLMESYHYMSYYLYICFTGIPFLWEFKKISDWTLTATALPLFHWMKFQDINASLYRSKCEAEMLETKKPGVVWYKYLIGPIGFLSILGLVFSPVIIYSEINPFAVRDSIIGSAIELNLVQDNTISYKFFSTSHVKSLGHVQDKDLNDINQSSFLTNSAISKDILAKEDMYKVAMSQYPDQNFLLSEPAVAKLSSRLNKTYQYYSSKKQVSKEQPPHTYSLSLNVMIIEKEGGENTLKWANKKLTPDEILQFHLLLENQRNKVQLNSYFSPFPGLLQSRTLQISTQNQCQYFEIQLTDPRAKNYTDKPLASDKQSNLFFFFATSTKFHIGFGVVTFYLTYVLLVSRLLRLYLTGSTENIIYEGWHMQKILVLCDAVRQARILQKFEKEESFYFELIDLMRAPKQLKNISGNFSTMIKINHSKQKSF